VISLGSIKEPSHSAHDIHNKIKKDGMTLFPYFFLEEVANFHTSCLQVTDTSIWYVLQKQRGECWERSRDISSAFTYSLLSDLAGLFPFDSAICSIDFATPLGEEYISPDSPVLQIRKAV
jgi:hypothetical protein